ncbi:hypothetical protein DI487_15290 [Flavobacterium sediminis]|uniref:Trimeric autotransporter adhesin YadA-like head domain-containing protein n=1 Tax=Flavobacterium sediminis TaxID=2201181 RepID=A0A2U8QYD7_9FLAO|nr:hypothetical protein [Flavobacterium sediminis]AWM15079.1 hypothetical protein DI487_15290 [Flavobacterium sediminis]
MKRNLLSLAGIAMLLLSTVKSHSQVGIGTTTPDASSILEIKSTNSGLLIPRVSLLSTADASTIPFPATSLLVYNTSTNSDVTPGYYYWEGVWKRLATVGGAASIDDWKLVGNDLVTGNEYLGTNNYYPLVLKVNTEEIGNFHPNGGISLGIYSIANVNNSVAIGNFADASGQVRAFAIGVGSIASGTSSYAIGESSYSSNTNSIAFGNSATSSATSSTAIGYGSDATGTYSTAVGFDNTASASYSGAFGYRSVASGVGSTAIGYRATSSQTEAIVLGNSSSSSARVGIGTNTPDEKLHVVGSIKMVDGNQGNGKTMVSDANGKGRWVNMDSYKIYGEIYKYSSPYNLYSGILSFDILGASQNLNLSYTAIQNQTRVGVFKVTYSITLQKTTGPAITPYFYLGIWGTEINGTRSYVTIANGETKTITLTKYVNLLSYQGVTLSSSMADPDTQVISANMIVELVN